MSDAGGRIDVVALAREVLRDRDVSKREVTLARAVLQLADRMGSGTRGCIPLIADQSTDHPLSSVRDQ